MSVSQMSASDPQAESDSELVILTSESKQPQKKRPRSIVASTSLSHPADSGDLVVRTPSPPSPLAAPLAAKDAYTSPDRLRLREALMCGGEMGFKVVQKCKTFVIASRRVLCM